MKSQYVFASAAIPKWIFFAIISVAFAQLGVVVCLGQSLPNFEDQLPPAATDPDGQVLFADGTLYVLGTNFRDQIEIEHRRNSIHVWINGDHTTIDADELPIYQGFNMAGGKAAVVIAAFNGHDSIEIRDRRGDDISDVAIIRWVVFAGSGDDMILDDSAVEVVQIGGAGRDYLMGGPGVSLLGGGFAFFPSNKLEFAIMLPDFEQDVLIAGTGITFAVQQWFVRVQSVNSNAKLLTVALPDFGLWNNTFHLSKTEVIRPIAAPIESYDLRIEIDSIIAPRSAILHQFAMIFDEFGLPIEWNEIQ